ncbi:MAG: hypothetical protein A3K10_06590 [Bacteroidetes bacterium RIFCSPLOWO2_12_FULL_31_6]|nr:MAG: hypothetical protein A3K10_06590 [Bacteroidetes bacterium RIFCSPLOWO2_12_FULL_31_6]
MKKLFAISLPILKGKTEQLKQFSSDLEGRYKKEFAESRKKLGVQERSFLQSTPIGDLVIVTLEGRDPETAFVKLGEGTDEFTKWFAAQVKEIHGVDITQKSEFELPKLIAETELVEEEINEFIL